LFKWLDIKKLYFLYIHGCIPEPQKAAQESDQSKRLPLYTYMIFKPVVWCWYMTWQKILQRIWILWSRNRSSEPSKRQGQKGKNRQWRNWSTSSWSSKCFLFFKMIKFYIRFSYHKKTNYEIIIFVTFSNMRLMLECNQISYQF